MAREAAKPAGDYPYPAPFLPPVSPVIPCVTNIAAPAPAHQHVSLITHKTLPPVSWPQKEGATASGGRIRRCEIVKYEEGEII